jgi:hypothetical protein
MHMRGLAFVVGLGLLVALAPVRAGDEKKKGDGPSATHEKMAKLAGDYLTASKFTLPGGKSQESKGTAKLTPILGGRFVKEENASDLGGMPVSGLRLFGYNNAAGQYEAIWTYTGSTAIMNLVGKKKDEKTVEFSATVAIAKDKKTDFTIIYRIVDDDSFTVDLIASSPDGTKGPMLQTTYTRKR